MNGHATLSHLFVLVSHLARSKRFYVDVLGLEVLLEENGYLRIGGASGFHMGMEEGLPDRVGSAGIEIVIQVDDIDKRYEELRASGIDFESAPSDQPWGARHAWLRDPDGYRLSIFSPIAGEAP
jgi:catechol 2,3-dioxygenase-like lactoylglutathione lyase family enzyme